MDSIKNDKSLDSTQQKYTSLDKVSQSEKIKLGSSDQNSFSHVQGVEGKKGKAFSINLDAPKQKIDWNKVSNDFPILKHEKGKKSDQLEQLFGGHLHQVVAKDAPSLLSVKQNLDNKEELFKLSNTMKPKKTEHAVILEGNESERQVKERNFMDVLKDVTLKLSAVDKMPEDLQKDISTSFENLTSKLKGQGSGFDIDSATTQLMLIQTKFQDERIVFNQEVLKLKQVEQSQISDKRITKIQEAIEKMEKAMNSSSIGRIFGFIAVAFGAILTAAMFATGVGAVAGGFMTAALALSVTMLASSESNNFMMKAFGDSKDAQIGAMVFWSALSIALSLGAASASGVSQAGATTSKVASKIAADTAKTGAHNIAKTAAKEGAKAAARNGDEVASVSATAGNNVARESSQSAKMVYITDQIKRFAQLNQGAATLGDGASQIATTEYKYRADILRAEAHEDKAFMMRIQRQIEDTTEALERAIQDLNSGYSAIVGIMKSNHDTKTILNKNLRA